MNLDFNYRNRGYLSTTSSTTDSSINTRETLNVTQKKFLKNLDFLLKVSSKLFKCAIKKCGELVKMSNTNDKLKKVLKTKNLNKKEKYIKKLAYNEKTLNVDKCTYNKCKEIHVKLLKVLIKNVKFVMSNYPRAQLFNRNIKKALIELNKLMKKTNLSSSDITEMNKHKNLLFFTILNLKP